MKKNFKRNSPILITGTWRCGTTLISRILNNHKNLSITYDMVHFLRFGFGKYDPINNEKNYKKLIDDIIKRLKYRFKIKLNRRNILKKIQGKYNYAFVYNAIMDELLLNNHEKYIWGEKTNLAWREIPNFFKMFPNGTVIHLIRDPRAVLASWKNFTNSHGNDYLDTVLNCKDSMSYAKKFRSKYKNKKYIVLRYEDLVLDPKKTISRICKIIGIHFDLEMLNLANFKDKFGNKWKSNSIHKNKINKISTMMINIWQTKLAKWEIIFLETIIGKLLNYFGYKFLLSKKSDKKNNEKAILEICKSKLATEGLVRYLLTSEAVQRFPSDPSNPNNWGKFIKNIN